MYLKYFLVVFLMFAVSCSPKSEKMELMGLQTILWYQFSAEAEALYIQAYNVAEDVLAKIDQNTFEKPLAITLDLDETVLDNSPFSVHMLRQGLDYSEEKWAEWCERREAVPLPGVLEFLNFADSLGFEVFYVSNRKYGLMGATLDNLHSYNIPFSDSTHLLLKTTSSSKDERRSLIRANYEIVMLIGDNLGDFEGVFDDRTVNYGKETVMDFEKEFGSRFIILPNPIYGSWERGAFPDGKPDQHRILDMLRGY